MSMIDGLVSGLDTTGIINKLIAVEHAPVDRLTSRQTDAKNAASVLANLRSLIDKVESAAKQLNTTSGWQAVRASSSAPAVADVSASSTATPGSLSFTVDRVATTHTLLSGGAAQAVDVAWATGDIVINSGGTDHTITVDPDPVSGVRTLNDVVSAIDAAGIGVTAQAVQVSAGQYRLQLSATSTGAAGQFGVVSGLVPAFDTTATGQDARIVFSGGVYDATSSTNTFAGLLPGVDVTVKATSATPVTVTVSHDPNAIASKVQALVSAVNNALANIKAATAYDSTNNKASILTGDPSVRRLAQDLTRGLVDGVGASSVGAPSLAGITLAKDGTVSFDQAKFLDTYADDAAGVQALFFNGDTNAPGLADRLVTVADAATATGSGYLQTAEQSERDRADEIGRQISRIEDRLDRESAALRKKFADMETALGSLRSQSDWLTSQLASLATPGKSQ